MHKKSIFTFGLLASSLVMLAVTPFLNSNNNNFSNVMAQEYDKYRDSYYSQYPTDDKKYECRTGPFEGFFVSSVEFCKNIKFDDKDRKDHSRDNRTGTQGPPGPAGPQGIQGPPGINGTNGAIGPSGITQLNATNVYFVNASSPETDGFAFREVLCDPGDMVLNGGYNLAESDFGFNDTVITFIDQSVTNGTLLGGGWEAGIIFNGENPFINLHVNALCFDNPPLRP